MKIVILGAGESGVGAAILAQQKGYEVFVSDMGHIQDKYKAQLSAHNLRWEEGKHTPEAILDADESRHSGNRTDGACTARKGHSRH